MRATLLALVFSVAALPVWANARITVLMDVLRITEIVEIMRLEGVAYARLLNEDMLQGQGGAFWQAQVAQIYDTDRIAERLRMALETQLNDAQIAAALAFFGSDLGQRILTLENAARRAMADPDVEEAALDFALMQQDARDPMFLAVQDFIAANDLIERNVSGAMSANLHFYKGLSDGHLVERPEAEILDEVWSQQEDIRADTEDWLNGFLLLAYHPLTEPSVQAYVSFSTSPEGQALNAALFDGFEAVYRDISYALGRAVALNARGDEI